MNHRCRVFKGGDFGDCWWADCPDCEFDQDATAWWIAMGWARKHWAEHNPRRPVQVRLASGVRGGYLIDQFVTPLSPIEMRQMGPPGPFQFH